MREIRFKNGNAICCMCSCSLHMKIIISFCGSEDMKQKDLRSPITTIVYRRRRQNYRYYLIKTNEARQKCFITTLENTRKEKENGQHYIQNYREEPLKRQSPKLPEPSPNPGVPGVTGVPGSCVRKSSIIKVALKLFQFQAPKELK